MNPNIPVHYDELGRWLRNFVASHGKRDDSRLEVRLDAEATREGASYGFRLVLGPASHPPAGDPPLELSYAEVAEGRPRFAWCDALGTRIRDAVRDLKARLPSEGRGR